MNVIEVKGKTYTELAEARKEVDKAADHARELAQIRTPPEHTRVTLSAEAQHIQKNADQIAVETRRVAALTGVSRRTAEGIATYEKIR